MINSKVKKLLVELVKIPSYVDENNDESKLIKFISEFVEKRTKYTVTLQKVEKNRSNLIIKGKGAPKVILFGHTDTVMPKSKNSLKPVERNNRLYGLGAVDMKSGVAVMLNQLEKFGPESGLCLILTVDEEYDFKGARKLIEKYKFSPKYIVNLEPTNLKIVPGCRGITEFSFEVYGKTAHASRKSLGINAIESSIAIYEELNKELDKLNKKSSAKSTLNVAHLNGGVLSNEGNVVCAANIVPNYAKTTGEIRVAHDKVTEVFIKKVLTKTATKLGAKIKKLKFRFYLGPMITEKSKFKEFESALKLSKLPVKYADVNKSGYYEVQIPFSIWAGTTIVFGPSPTSKCHSEDEYVDLDSVYKTNEVIENFLTKTLAL